MRLRRANVLTILVLLALIVYACASLFGIQKKLTDAARTEAGLEEQVAALESENAALQYAIDNADDPDVIAGVARDELGLVGPDDKVFHDREN